MRAIVYHGPGQRVFEEVPDPEITDDADVIVRVDATTICGTDLHILNGDVPTVRPGRILGHEAVGTVEDTGSSVRTMGEGDRVLVSCISACGACRYCRDGRYGQCLGGGGWILGNTYNGTQAEFVRVPFADTSTYRLPAAVTDEEVLMLADILPTGYEVGVLKAGVQPGDVVAVVGAGPVGLAAIMGARLFSPSHIVAIDIADRRLEAAKQLADRGTRRGCHVRGRRKAGDLRPGRPAHASRSARREHRRAREARSAASGRSVDPGSHHHHRAGGHLLHAHFAAPAGQRPARCAQTRDASFRFR